MNPLVLELQAGFDERMDAIGQRFRLERTGDEWDAILIAVQPMDPQLELGADWREMATMEARRDHLPDIQYGDIVKQLFPFYITVGFEPQPRWKVIRRDDNPANFAIKFWLVKIVPGRDDTTP